MIFDIKLFELERAESERNERFSKSKFEKGIKRQRGRITPLEELKLKNNPFLFRGNCYQKNGLRIIQQ